MRVLDLNVVLVVVQNRQPHYIASAAIVDRVVRGMEQAALPAHAFTMVHFLVTRYRDAVLAGQVVDWLLQYFDVAAIGRGQLLQARSLGWPDFEDAVVASAAAAIGANAIITRNVKDFAAVPVTALTPEEYLLQQ